jgi:hypothetical protein
MASSAGSNELTFESIGVKNTTINAAPSVELTNRQKVLVGSVLDVRTPDVVIPSIAIRPQRFQFHAPSFFNWALVQFHS